MNINRKVREGEKNARESVTRRLATETHEGIFFRLRVKGRNRQGVTSGIKEEERNAACLDTRGWLLSSSVHTQGKSRKMQKPDAKAFKCPRRGSGRNPAPLVPPPRIRAHR